MSWLLSPPGQWRLHTNQVTETTATPNELGCNNVKDSKEPMTMDCRTFVGELYAADKCRASAIHVNAMRFVPIEALLCFDHRIHARRDREPGNSEIGASSLSAGAGASTSSFTERDSEGPRDEFCYSPHTSTTRSPSPPVRSCSPTSLVRQLLAIATTVIYSAIEEDPVAGRPMPGEG